MKLSPSRLVGEKCEARGGGREGVLNQAEGLVLANAAAGWEEATPREITKPPLKKRGGA